MTGLRQHTRSDGKPPFLYSLSRRGLEVAQGRKPAPAISPKRDWRPIEQPRAGRLAHDLHAIGWTIEFHRTVGDTATDRWRTPRYATGRYPVPQVGSGQRRHQIALNEIKLPDGRAIIDLELKTFTEIKPDLSLELRIESVKLTFDLLVEIDLTARPSYNREKFLGYDAFLCGWCLAHARFRALGTRPAVVFVCPTAQTALTCAREADELMTGRLGLMGTPAEHWYYAGRDHTCARRRAARPSVPSRPKSSYPSGLFRSRGRGAASSRARRTGSSRLRGSSPDRRHPLFNRYRAITDNWYATELRP